MHSMQEPEYDPFELARYCLRYLKPRSNREDWIKVGMACHSVGDGLLPDWLAWSSQANNYKDGEARRRSYPHLRVRMLCPQQSPALA